MVKQPRLFMLSHQRRFSLLGSVFGLSPDTLVQEAELVRACEQSVWMVSVHYVCVRVCACIRVHRV